MINYEIVKTEGQRQKVQAFAGSFEHMVSFHYPVVMIKVNDQLAAYVEIIQSPVLNFGFKPEICGARETSQIVGEVTAWAKIQHGECFVVRPQDVDTKFTNDVMEKLGFINTKKDVFVAKD